MKTPHAPARTGAVRVAVIGGALCLGLSTTAQPSHADQPGGQPVAVINGDFALPAITGTTATYVSTPYVHGWSAGVTNGAGVSYGVLRYPGTNSGHPGGKVAVMLRSPVAATYSFMQRLRGVRAGAQVTVTFDDSPGVAPQCTPAAVAAGQPYTVEGVGGALSERTTAPDPDKKVNTLGTGAWRLGQSYTFTAGENEPLLTFISQVGAPNNANTNCGPMIADVRAVHIPPPVDKTIPKSALPASEAFYGNDRRTVADAVNYCAGALGRCVFTPEEAYSYSYYEPAQVNGDTYINCTRNALTRTRPVTLAGRSYGDLPANAGLPGGAAAASVMAQQFTAGSSTSPDWNPSLTRSVTEVFQPSEVSWVETQAGRRRVEGWFTSNPTPADPQTEWRLYTVLDHPSTDLSDRIYQRTGPMTAFEKQRCQSNRLTAPTPVGASTPAGANRTP
ncbi:hypothetical protein AB0M44_42430 [Streptosporangium subroseum]|uniref:hypothetical protein n=1 Tax=Streptosporangium subroseum TaxID=106412 RepID=UPI0034376352